MQLGRFQTYRHLRQGPLNLLLRGRQTRGTAGPHQTRTLLSRSLYSQSHRTKGDTRERRRTHIHLLQANVRDRPPDRLPSRRREHFLLPACDRRPIVHFSLKSRYHPPSLPTETICAFLALRRISVVVQMAPSTSTVTTKTTLLRGVWTS